MPNSLNVEAQSIINFLQYSEGLKTEERSLNLSTGIPENVAAHSWRMGLMVMLIAPHLQEKNLNVEKMLRMALVHDLVEVEAGDISVLDHYNNAEVAAKKVADEENAMTNIKSMLNIIAGDEIEYLWRDYDNQGSLEARVVKAIDKLEARLQLILDKDRTFSLDELKVMEKVQKKAKELCQVDPFLAELERITAILPNGQ